MVAIINTGTSIRSTFHYNENKVKEGVADCIMAQNYPIDTEMLSEKMRLNMLLNMTDRNPDVKRKSMHISLNFAPEEKPSNDQMLAIANEYMERIGFGLQPFLVYRHYDSGHPHIHIVTTKIKADGSCIDTNNIGRNRSEPARKEIEIKYGLVKAEDQKASLYRMQPLDASKVLYGKQVTKRAISSVLREVIDKYKYTSLPELNAVLNLYNITAERGKESSRTYKTNGLVYRVLGKDGQSVSAPIKASAFHMKPTMKYLEGKFLRNDLERQQYRSRLKSLLTSVLKNTKADSLQQFSLLLARQQIQLVERRNRDGLLYGATFVDLKNKVVFNGSDLDKALTAQALTLRFPIAERVNNLDLVSAEIKVQSSGPAKKSTQLPPIGEPEKNGNMGDKSLIEQLLQVEYGNNYLPFELRSNARKKKKRRRKHL